MTEFIVVVTSEQREKDSCHIDNPTNDVKIYPKFSVNRMLITSLDLLTVEFPRTQTLIEPCWSRIYTFRGFQESGKSLKIEDCENCYIASIPQRYNKIINVEHGNIFETEYPHLLPTSNAQVVGLQQIICDSFKIISCNKFQVLNECLHLHKNDIVGAMLYSPPEASPVVLAARLTKEWNQSYRKENQMACGDPFLLEWDCYQSRFTLTSNIKNMSLIVDCDSLNLGFTIGKLSLSTCKIIAAFVPKGTSFIKLSSGNYLVEEMTTEINFQFNVGRIVDGSILTISNENGPFQIKIPSGSYTPITLCTTITHLLVTTNITLHYCDGIYTFESQNNFNLEFADINLTNIAYQLGFRPTYYCCEKKYCSQDRIYDQETCNNNAFNTDICDAQVNIDGTTLTLYFSRPRQLMNATITQASNHQWLVTDHDRALGVQVNDLVQIGSNIRVRVAYVLSGTEFLVDAKNLNPPKKPQIVQFVIPSTVSIFVLNCDQAVKPTILGLGEKDLIYECGKNYLTFPYHFRLNPLSFVLIEMVDPICSARIEYRYKNVNKTTILGKVILNYEPVQEKNFMQHATFFSGIRVTSFHFRLLNPDLSLYALHGQNFALTLKLNSEQNPNSLISGSFGTSVREVS